MLFFFFAFAFHKFSSLVLKYWYWGILISGFLCPIELLTCGCLWNNHLHRMSYLVCFVYAQRHGNLHLIVLRSFAPMSTSACHWRRIRREYKETRNLPWRKGKLYKPSALFFHRTINHLVFSSLWSQFLDAFSSTCYKSQCLSDENYERVNMILLSIAIPVSVSN